VKHRQQILSEAATSHGDAAVSPPSRSAPPTGSISKAAGIAFDHRCTYRPVDPVTLQNQRPHIYAPAT